MTDPDRYAAGDVGGLLHNEGGYDHHQMTATRHQCARCRKCYDVTRRPEGLEGFVCRDCRWRCIGR